MTAFEVFIANVEKNGMECTVVSVDTYLKKVSFYNRLNFKLFEVYAQVDEKGRYRLFVPMSSEFIADQIDYVLSFLK